MFYFLWKVFGECVSSALYKVLFEQPVRRAFLHSVFYNFVLVTKTNMSTNT